MQATYGVVWREGEAPLARGRLELLPWAVRLDGVAGSHLVTRELRYDELEAVRVVRAGGERLNGRPTLMLERRDGQPIVVAAVAQSGVVAELTERLAKLTLA